MKKTMFDFFLSLIGFAFLFPILCLLSLILLFTIGTPILFKQKRPGLYGKSFNFYKFRTMTNRKDKNGNILPDEDRLTSFGEFLRKTSFDELPSLWNVFKGDMSIVGPRPLLMEYLPLYTREQARRHEVKPGITGWAQINGRNAISWKEKFELDVWYVNNQSFWLDFKIILLTIFKVLKQKDINQSNHATMSKFQGSK